MVRLSRFRKSAAHSITEPLARFLAKTPITPDALTWLGFLVVLVATALIATGHLFAAGWVVLFAGFFDIMDGALARSINRVTRSGALLDSTLDRVSEAALFLGILFIFAREQSVPEILLVGLALFGSMLVSYVKARGEGLGLECDVGIFTRAERVLVLALGLLLSSFAYVLVIALAIICVLSFFTAGQRFIYLWRRTRIE